MCKFKVGDRVVYKGGYPLMNESFIGRVGVVGIVHPQSNRRLPNNLTINWLEPQAGERMRTTHYSANFALVNVYEDNDWV